MKNSLISLVSGLLFGAGLILGEMTRPERVIGFLNIFGDWDPSLIFVMGGAVLTHSILYIFIKKRTQPIFTNQWSIPSNQKISLRLVLGSFIFGVGWALGGYCPGPGITALSSLDVRPIVFVVFMVIGMMVFRTTSATSR